jgi:hypothetical protein
MWGGKRLLSPACGVAHLFALVNLWLSERFSLFSSAIIGFVGLISVFARFDASLAGFALVFANTITIDVSSGLRLFLPIADFFSRS